MIDEKDAAAAKAAATAKQKGDEAAALRLKANALPPGTPDKSAMNAKAALLEGERDDLLAAAKVAGAEADALRKGIAAAGSDGLRNEDLTPAAVALRQGQRSLGLDHLKSAAARLDRLIALTENPWTRPDLKKWKKNADDPTRSPRRRTTFAGGRPSREDHRPENAAALRAAGGSGSNSSRGKEVFQRLVRDRPTTPRADAGRSSTKWTPPATTWKGNPGMRPERGVERLDNARDKLDTAATTAPQNLADEQRRNWPTR